MSDYRIEKTGGLWVYIPIKDKDPKPATTGYETSSPNAFLRNLRK